MPNGPTVDQTYCCPLIVHGEPVLSSAATVSNGSPSSKHRRFARGLPMIHGSSDITSYLHLGFTQENSRFEVGLSSTTKKAV
jgi:hypothetical protein